MPILRCKIASFLLVFGTVKGEELNEHARQRSEKSLGKEPAALERFGVWNGRKDFARFHIDKAMGSVRIRNRRGARTASRSANPPPVRSWPRCVSLRCGCRNKVAICHIPHDYTAAS